MSTKLRPSKVRYVGYRGDGVEVLHCLACGNHIPLQCSLSYVQVQFCPFCGTCWALGHVTDRRRQDLRNRCWRASEPELVAWVLEWRDPDMAQWSKLMSNWSEVRRFHGTALRAYEELKERRRWNDQDSTEELRVRSVRVVDAEKTQEDQEAA